jgi:phage tail sheath protein FI
MSADSVKAALLELESYEDIRILVCPDAVTVYDPTDPNKNSDEAKAEFRLIQQAMIAHCEKPRMYRFAILDTPKGLDIQGVMEWREAVGYDSKHAALYYPWVQIDNMINNETPTRLVPPSGLLSGLYGRTDAVRGVHKAPANDTLFGVVGVGRRISNAENALLNRTPVHINCIREFPGQGIRVWGARTLSSNQAWRYISVRRLFDMVEASMELGLHWVVFEPNNIDLWERVVRDVTAFLKLVWRSGALFGATPEEAFFVACNEALNPPEVRDQGVLVIQIGMAPVKPAEFVMLQFLQMAGPNAQA